MPNAIRRPWLAVAVLLGAVAGCGGESNGTFQHVDFGGGGSGGGLPQKADAGAAAGERPAPLDDAASGSRDSGAAACKCAARACAPGTRRVQTAAAAQCCSPCEPCGKVACGATPSCGAGEEPVIGPGQCCPETCEPIRDAGSPGNDDGSTGDATPTCRGTTTPQCSPQRTELPFCAPDWEAAVNVFGCDSVVRLSQCGAYHLMTERTPVLGVFESDTFYYDRSGRLVGYLEAGQYCEAYDDPSFVLPRGGCVPMSAACSGVTDAAHP